MVGGEEVGAVTARGQQQHLASAGMPVQPGRDVVNFSTDINPTQNTKFTWNLIEKTNENISVRNFILIYPK